MPPAIVLFLFAARRTAPLFYDRGQKKHHPRQNRGEPPTGVLPAAPETAYHKIRQIARAAPRNCVFESQPPFCPLPQFQKWEIHTVFLHFRNFELGQKFWLRLLAELCGVAQGKLRSELCESIPHSKTPRRRRYCAAGVSLLLFHQIGQRHAV